MVENSLSVTGFNLKLLKDPKNISLIKKTLKKLIKKQNPNFNKLKKSLKNKSLSIWLEFHQDYSEDEINPANLEMILRDMLSDEKNVETNERGLGLINFNNEIFFSPYCSTMFSNIENEGFKISFSEINTEYREKGICEDCEKPLNDCVCGYNVILNIPEFIQRRSQHIFNKKRCKIMEFHQLSSFITEILNNMPNIYHTRSGHAIEDHYVGEYSDHDAARFIGTSIMFELNELLVNLTVGSYDSSIRGIRNLFEWTIRTTVGITNAGSITRSNKDKNFVSCFHTVKESYRLSEKKRKMDNKTKKAFNQEIKDDENLSERDKRIWLSDIGFGVTKFIYNCDSKLLKYVKSNDLRMSAIKILDSTYEQLSQYIHKSSELLEEMEQNNGKLFFDSDDFDYAFRLCYVSLDYIFYFYFLLLDIDVYHGNIEWKMQCRKNLKRQFQNLILSNENMLSSRSLLNSDEWNSNPPKEFAKLIKLI